MTDAKGPDPRIESGSISFGDDWPGLFLRGDDAMGYAIQLQYILDVVDEDDIDAISLHIVRALLHHLKSVDFRNDKVQRQQLKTARECLVSTPTLPGPPPELNPWTDETWIGDDGEKT
jgi:hypothetical protein